MKDKKLQVFVSSTYTDLIEERQAAVEAILSSGHIPAGMELFSAGDESQMTVIERWIDESDVYLLILGGRYGSIDKKTGKSYTHLEYEYALSKNKPMFAVVINEKALDLKVQEKGRLVLEQDNTKELKVFKDIVTSNLVKFWDDKKDIKIAIHETIADFSYRKELVGWIRGDNSVNTGVLAEEMARLTKENSELKGTLENNSSKVLYAGLTFEELKKLLLNKKVKVEKRDWNAYSFLMTNGNFIASKQTDLEKLRKDGLNVLALFKLVRIIGQNEIQTKCEFTEDGHNFYIKALSKANDDFESFVGSSPTSS
jgi:D-ribose pyranose/furanose isomerase RbsD